MIEDVYIVMKTSAKTAPQIHGVFESLDIAGDVVKVLMTRDAAEKKETDYYYNITHHIIF